MIKSKKGAEQWAIGSMPFFIIFVAFIGVGVSIFVLIINSFASEDVSIPQNVEEIILLERFYNSPECFAYKDNLGRTHQGVVDMSKFNKVNLDGCLGAVSSSYAFKLELEVPGDNYKQSVYTNNWYAGNNYLVQRRNVLTYSDNKMKNGIMLAYVQNA